MRVCVREKKNTAKNIMMMKCSFCIHSQNRQVMILRTIIFFDIFSAQKCEIKKYLRIFAMNTVLLTKCKVSID